MKYHEGIKNFGNEIQAKIGGNPGPIRADGQFHRFKTNATRKGKSGWYIAFSKDDLVAGAYGDWCEGETHTFRSKNLILETEERVFYEKSIENAKEQRRKVEKKARKRAQYIWGKAKSANPKHPYLQKKGIRPHGIKQFRNELIIPVYNNGNEIVSLQRIFPDGSKFFLKGGKASGGWYLITGEGDPILCEGFATGASLNEATSRPVLVAFNAGNMPNVAKPGCTIAADNDAFTTDKDNQPWNPGLEKSLRAAYQHNCPFVTPTFQNTDSKPTDFNDLHCLEGLATVADQIRNAVLPQDFLLKESETDPGAAFRKEHLHGLKLLQLRNKSAYMAVRQQLKKLKIGITEFEKDIKGTRLEDSQEEPDHLQLAKEIIEEIGDENLIFSESDIWRWDPCGVWHPVDPREIKKVIDAKIEKALQNPTKSTVDSIFDFIKTEIFRPRHEWNQSSETINVLNGELVFEGGEWRLKPHVREHYLTTQINIEYTPDGKAALFQEYLETSFQDDPDREDKMILVCELLGYSLVPTTRYEKFVILIGPGANGKSVLIELAIALVGAENAAGVQPSKFDSPFQRAYLNHKLINAVSELAVGEAIKDDRMKSITSGESITCEHKFKDPFNMRPVCTIWLASNHMPRTKDFSPALFRRALIIPFNRVFQEFEQDKKLKSKLVRELPGILNYALEAVKGVFKRGFFTEPESCRVAKTEVAATC